MENCPVCKQHTFKWTYGGLGVVCTNCGLKQDTNIPWDKEVVEKAIQKYNDK